MMEAACTSETSVYAKTTRRYNPEGTRLLSHFTLYVSKYNPVLAAHL